MLDGRAELASSLEPILSFIAFSNKANPSTLIDAIDPFPADPLAAVNMANLAIAGVWEAEVVLDWEAVSVPILECPVEAKEDAVVVVSLELSDGCRSVLFFFFFSNGIVPSRCSSPVLP